MNTGNAYSVVAISERVEGESIEPLLPRRHPVGITELNSPRFRVSGCQAVKSEPIAVACVADDAYALPLAVTLLSAMSNLDRERRLAIYVIDAGISDQNKQAILRSLDAKRASVTWVPHAAARLNDLPMWGRMSLHTYERILTAELLPATVSKVIWLDSDLVVKADLSALWQLDMSGKALLAAQDILVPFVSSSLGIKRYRELGFTGQEKYFNAGVMVLDLDRWRAQGFGEKTMAYLREHRDDVILWDQDGLNVVLRADWGELDPRWNHNAGVCGRSFFKARHLTPAAYREVVDHPWIVHFSGALKPWIVESATASCAQFFEYVDKTAWAGWRPRKTLRGALVARYGASSWRDLVYPVEERGLRLWRALTFRTSH